MNLGRQHYKMVNGEVNLPHNYISTSNPTIDVNPPIINMTWLNQTTSEIFVCTDNKVNDNVWSSKDNTIRRIPTDYIDEFSNLESPSSKNSLPISPTTCIELMGSQTTITTFTISCYVKVFEVDGSSAIMSCYYPSNGHHFGLRVLEGTSTFHPNVFSDDDDSWQSISGDTKNLNEWVFLLAEWDLPNNTIGVRVNDGDLNTTTVTHNSITMSGNLWVGRDGDGYQTSGTKDFIGDIKHLRYYDRILTVDEIAQLYSEGLV